MNTLTLIISFSTILFLIYFVIKLLYRKSYTGAINKANKEIQVSVNGSSSNCSYSLWIYINKWTNSDKILFTRGTFSVGINSSINTLYVKGIAGPISYTNYQNSYFPSSVANLDPIDNVYYPGSDENCQKKCNSQPKCNSFNYYSKYDGATGCGGYSNITVNGGGATGGIGCILLGYTGATTPPPVVSPSTLVPNTDTNALFASIKNVATVTSKIPINNYIPLQEWVFIVVQMNSTYFEVYINGKLVNTTLCTAQVNTATPVVLSPNGTGFDGWNSKFEFKDSMLTSTEIWNKYKQGYGNYISLSDYSIKVDITQNENK